MTIAAGTLANPGSYPASLQMAAGVDQRSQAAKVTKALTEFRNRVGLTLKISKDPGVSNQWREGELNQQWVSQRRKPDQPQAQAFLAVVSWLQQAKNATKRHQRAQRLLDEISAQIVTSAVGNRFYYPQPVVSPRQALSLVLALREKVVTGRPDVLEAVVAAAAKVMAAQVSSAAIVQRRHVNSPDQIDVVITTPATGGALLNLGIEVTDSPLAVRKLQHEVVPGMIEHGLKQALVVSRGIKAEEQAEVYNYCQEMFRDYGLQILLTQVSVLAHWFENAPKPYEVSTAFVQAVGEELDQHSAVATRQAWLKILRNSEEFFTYSQPDVGQVDPLVANLFAVQNPTWQQRDWPRVQLLQPGEMSVIVQSLQAFKREVSAAFDLKSVGMGNSVLASQGTTGPTTGSMTVPSLPTSCAQRHLADRRCESKAFRASRGH